MIKAEHISKSFDGRAVLDDISVTFDTGKTNLIIGRSGSGKTVLLKSLVGLHAVDSGAIYYDDICYTSLGFKERNVYARSFSRDNLSYIVRNDFDKERRLISVALPTHRGAPLCM